MEPISLTLLMTWFVAQVLVPLGVELGAPHVRSQLITPAIRRVTRHPSVQHEMSEAWKAACQDIFAAFIDSPSYARLASDEQDLVRERAKIWTSDDTVAVLSLSDSVDAEFAGFGEDLTGLFLADSRRVTERLLRRLYALGIWEGLPGDLEAAIKQHLLARLYSRFVEKAITN